MKSTKAYFINHCEDECGLGLFEYTCPKCDKTIENYDIWFEQDTIQECIDHEFECENCNQSLVIEWNDSEFIVKTIEL